MSGGGVILGAGQGAAPLAVGLRHGGHYGPIRMIRGGYIGLEVAAVMRQEGRDAIVVEAEGRVMKRVAGETISGFFDGLHRARGVDIRLGCRLASIDGDDSRATGITLASGERIA